MDRNASDFRLLLAEDDPISLEFLDEAVRACGVVPSICRDGRGALELAQATAFDLLIFDHRMPGLDGDAVLVALRTDPAAASHNSPAVATSAARDSELDMLLGVGFAAVLPKPMPLAAVQEVLHQHGCSGESTLDDDDALLACGSREAVIRLRRLFVEQELPKVQDELNRIANDPEAFRPTLHRLRASCGFCGARALAHASASLHRELAVGSDPQRTRLAILAFRRALAATRTALHTSLEASV